jgi:hypothetical protein
MAVKQEEAQTMTKAFMTMSKASLNEINSIAQKSIQSNASFSELLKVVNGLNRLNNKMLKLNEDARNFEQRKDTDNNSASWVPKPPR